MEIDEPNEFRNYIVLDREQLQKFFPRPFRDYAFEEYAANERRHKASEVW